MSETGERDCNEEEKICKPKACSHTSKNDHLYGSLAPILLTVVGLVTRLHKIDEPDHVCWDETHFGKMGSWYINGTFFFDVHPPLGKMLVGLAGAVTGYNGSFPFSKPGDKYGDTPYVGMRVICAMAGTTIIPFSYGTIMEMTKSGRAATLGASFILLDTGVLSLSQYILLDPFLLCFIMATTYCAAVFSNLKNRSFSFLWWFWLVMTGTFLACSVGVKFVGLFVVALVGLTTIRDLWQLLGDLKVSMADLVKHFAARAGCLICLPVFLYVLFYWIHFSVLHRSGSGDGFFSSAFQSQLEGNPLYKVSMPREVAYGSVVTIKNHRTAGAYLHSHWHLYPDGLGARQQQVTTYAHKDENNKWIFKNFNKESSSNESVEYLKNGDLVRLEHVMTGRNLHSHKEMAPVTKRHFQVTCYGENGTGDANDIFRLELVKGSKDGHVRTVKSVFRLIHLYVGCALHSHNKQLPKWGWEQLEVTCNPSLRDKRSLWNIEEVHDQRLQNYSFNIYAPTFSEKLIESHAVMAQGNSGLKPKDGEVTSQPWQWPITYKGQPFSGPEYRVYLLGNPVIWWSNLVILILFLLISAALLIKAQRCRQIWQPGDARAVLISAGGWLLLGWLLHYLPFWSMTRVLYFHHYFPAFLYSCMLSGVMLDYLLHQLSCTFNVSSILLDGLVGVLLSGLAYSFYVFSPLSYGMTGPTSEDPQSVMHGLKWLSTWDF